MRQQLVLNRWRCVVIQSTALGLLWGLLIVCLPLNIGCYGNRIIYETFLSDVMASFSSLKTKEQSFGKLRQNFSYFLFMSQSLLLAQAGAFHFLPPPISYLWGGGIQENRRITAALHRRVHGLSQTTEPPHCLASAWGHPRGGSAVWLLLQSEGPLPSMWGRWLWNLESHTRPLDSWSFILKEGDESTLVFHGSQGENHPFRGIMNMNLLEP